MFIYIYTHIHIEYLYERKVRERELERSIRGYVYGEDSVTEIAMDVTELVRRGEVVRWKSSGRGRHFWLTLFPFLCFLCVYSIPGFSLSISLSICGCLIWFDWWDWLIDQCWDFDDGHLKKKKIILDLISSFSWFLSYNTLPL